MPLGNKCAPQTEGRTAAVDERQETFTALFNDCRWRLGCGCVWVNWAWSHHREQNTAHINSGLR